MDGADMLSDYEVGWIEALIDGEGSLTWARGYPALWITQADRRILEKFLQLTKFGCINGPYQNKSAKYVNRPYYRFRMSCGGLREILPQLHLISKEFRRLEMMDWFDTHPKRKW